MKPTIKTVAERAGVGLSTVSRVINDNYPVSSESRIKVENAIRELGYSPNVIARSLKSRNTWLIGIVVDDISNQFYMQLVKSIEDVLIAKNYDIIISSSDGSKEKENRIINRFLDRCVDGLIIATCQENDKEIARVKARGVPLVLVDRNIENAYYNAVLEDNEANSYEITDYLIKCGHKRICIVNGFSGINTVKTRHQGFIKAHKENALEVNEKLVIYHVSDQPFENMVLTRLTSLSKDEFPTAIFTTNNTRCEMIIKVLYDMNLKVPDDVSLASYGNISNPWMFYSKLTHIRQDVTRIGKKTGEIMLENLIDDRIHHTREYIINSEIVYGDSVKNIGNPL